ncbi:hypothetical protein SLU01_17390 [Sporosarcina luteola]|uniref:Uncharacterized protein n=1 Tax=Sporosarcina luteola TaxID=582850 RepID=A0A511Z7K7_9BACL|nr:hypothetical protein SLU01_17390 [Sporosarcina luteola]
MLDFIWAGRFGRAEGRFGRAEAPFGRGLLDFGRAEARFGRDSKNLFQNIAYSSNLSIFQPHFNAMWMEA